MTEAGDLLCWLLKTAAEEEELKSSDWKCYETFLTMLLHHLEIYFTAVADKCGASFIYIRQSDNKFVSLHGKNGNLINFT